MAIRISDADRERTAQDLREHFAAGRMTEEELDERVQAAYAARTDDDLRTLTTDLPALPVSSQQRKDELAQRRALLQRRMLQESGGAVGLFVLCTVVWVVSGAHGQFWPVWVGIVAALALLRNGWRLYGPAPDLDRVERDLDRRRQRGSRVASRHRRRDGRF